MTYLAALYISGSLILGYQEYVDERAYGTGKREAILRGLLVTAFWLPLRIYTVWQSRR